MLIPDYQIGERHVGEGQRKVWPPAPQGNVIGPQVQEGLSHQRLETGTEQILSRSLCRDCGPAGASISDICLQNCERINFGYSKPPSVW